MRNIKPGSAVRTSSLRNLVIDIAATALLCASLFFLSTGVHAATPEDAAIPTLDEIVVTATAEEDDASLTAPSLETARERIDITPGGVDIVAAEEYKTGRASTLQDALKYSPGVYVQPRFGSEEARLSIRGSGIQRTFHLRGLKLLQDGVPLNQADGGGDFQAIEPLATDYIEVYRGANALQYGATTLGGAINFVSPSGYSAAPLQGRLEAGSFDYLRGQFSISGVRENGDYYASLSHLSQDGFRDHAKQSNQRFFSNAGYRFSDDLETRVYLTSLTSDSELPGNLLKSELENNPEQANPGNISGDQKRDFDLHRIASKTTFRWGESRLEASAFYAYKDLFHPIFQVLDIEYEDYGLDFRYVSEAPRLGRKNILTLGFTPVRGTADDRRFRNVLGERGDPVSATEQTSVNLDLYVENQHYIRPDVALIIGAQLSHASREQDDNFEDTVDDNLEQDYAAFSPKLGVRYEINPAAQVFANISRSFEPPSFGELYGGLTTSMLDEQTATTLELGTRGEYLGSAMIHALRWDIAYYHADIENELLGLTDPTTQLITTINADDTLHQGIELSLDIEFPRNTTLRQAYLYNDFRFDGSDEFGDNNIAGLPRHLYLAELVYRHPKGYYAGPNVEWSPERFAVDHANTFFNDSYDVWGFKFGYRPAKSGIGWFVDARNIFDATYAATTGVTAALDPLPNDEVIIADSRQFLPGDGRSVFIGLEWRL